MKAIFIINPISGVGKQRLIEALISKKIAPSIEYVVRKTEYANHGAEIAKEFVNKVDAVIAIGGDGTVLEIGSALTGTSTALGIIPTGSGNGLARNLGIPISIENAIGLINNHSIKTIDTGTVNDQVFLGTLGVGFDAHITKCFAEYGKRGFWSYIKLIFREYFSYKPQLFKLTIDGKSFEKRAWILCVANSAHYGNGAIISPNSSTNDGIFEVCALKKPTIFQVPLFVFRFFTGSIHKSSLMSRESGKEIVIQNNFELFHRDGEPTLSTKALEIKINPLSLKVIVPA